MFQSSARRLAFLASIFMATAVASVIQVDVGKAPLTFSPEVIEAEVGDFIEFRFYPQAHSVVLGEYSRPCSPAEMGGFYSGFVPVSAGTASDKVFRVRVNRTEPMFFYCSQGNHCPQGMVGAINPSGNQTLSAYAQNAIGRAVFAPFPDQISGGVFAHPTKDDEYPDDDYSDDEEKTGSPSTSADSGRETNEGGAGSGASMLTRHSAGALISFMVAVALV